MSTAPKVSVVIAAYNSMPYLHETLASLSDQSYRPLEIVLVDDGSSDGTSEYVQWARRWLLVVYARRDTLVHQGHERHVEHRVESYHSDGFTRLAAKWEQFEYLLHKRVTFGHATLLYRRDVLDAVGLFREERELMGMEHNGWLLKLFHYFFAHYLDEPVFLIRRGHRRDHLATVWDDNPDRNHVFDSVLVPRTLAELEGARP